MIYLILDQTDYKFIQNVSNHLNILKFALAIIFNYLFKNKKVKNIFLLIYKIFT